MLDYLVRTAICFAAVFAVNRLLGYDTSVAYLLGFSALFTLAFVVTKRIAIRSVKRKAVTKATAPVA